MAASVSDHLKMSNSNTAECFSAVETLAMRYAAVASSINAWDHWYATPAEPGTVVQARPSAPPLVPDPEPVAPTAPTGAPFGSSSGGSVLPFSVHPSQDCIYHPSACPDFGWPRGGGGTPRTLPPLPPSCHCHPPSTELSLLLHFGRETAMPKKHPHHHEPTSRRGTAEKQKEPAIPEWRAAPNGERYPSEPTAPWTGTEENSSSFRNINPLTKNVFTSPGKPSCTPSHPTDTCTVSPVKVAPRASGAAPPTMAPPRLSPVPNAYGAKKLHQSDG